LQSSLRMKTLLALLLFSLWSHNVLAQSSFYEGKTVKIIVGYPERAVRAVTLMKSLNMTVCDPIRSSVRTPLECNWKKPCKIALLNDCAS
jgi:hypothetical protein